MPLREQDLAAPVAGHFAAIGYRVFAEVGIAGRWADLVAIGPDDVVAIELKLRAWREALRQAMAYQLGADRAYVALPLRCAQDANRHRFAFESEGIGLLAVAGANLEVRTVFMARPSRRHLPWIGEALRRRLGNPFDSVHA